MNTVEQKIYDLLSELSFSQRILYGDADESLPEEDKTRFIKSSIELESKLSKLKEKYPKEYHNAERLFNEHSNIL